MTAPTNTRGEPLYPGGTMSGSDKDGRHRLVFTVLGRPTPQGSHRALIRGGHAVVVDQAGKRLRLWRATVARMCRLAVRDHPPAWGPWDPEAVKLTVQLIIERPARSKTPLGRWMNRRPDLDKLLRAVLDALTTGGAYADDSRVVELHAIKRWADEGEAAGAWIMVTDLGSGRSPNLHN